MSAEKAVAEIRVKFANNKADEEARVRAKDRDKVKADRAGARATRAASQPFQTGVSSAAMPNCPF